MALEPAPAGGGMDTASAQGGFYCSTSGSHIATKEALLDHYKSELHRYNLKRKAAGLPPVTKEWFEARRAQLTSTAAAAASTVTAAAPSVRSWVDPLTKKKFASENTYQAFVRSHKYAELVRKSGEPAPAPLVVNRSIAEAPAAAAPAPSAGPSAAAAARPVGFKLVPPPGGMPHRRDTAVVAAKGDTVMADGSGGEDEDEEGDGDEGGWETASEEEVAAAAAQQEGAEADGAEADKWEDWDLCRSFFDNHVSPTMQSNLEYMLKHFGFYLPDAEYLSDPEGLMRYLGAKLQQGGLPFYVSGEDASTRQFRSLHAVQRHMVDTCQCKVLYDGNEDEYAEFYDYDMGQEDGADDEDSSSALAIVAGGSEDPGTSGAVAGELVLPAPADGARGARILGSRDLARYYKQRHRPEDERRIVLVNTMLARYRALGAPTSTNDTRDLASKKAATRAHQAAQRFQLKHSIARNVLPPARNVKLPKDCPY